MIKREILSEIRKHLENPEITIIIGARQVGKTTMMRSLQKELDKVGKTSFYLNLDIQTDRQHFDSQSSLVNRLRYLAGNKKAYFFIDEVQRIQNAGLFWKGIYDMNLPYKLILSGSGSLELKEKIAESMSGRKRLFELPPISLREFINYKTQFRFSDRLSDYFENDQDEAKALLIEYLNFGGYPKVITSKGIKEKTATIAEIFNSYLLKDIKEILQVDKVDAFGNLIRLLAGQTGTLVNRTSLAQTLDITGVTVGNYIWYLEKTFIVSQSKPLTHSYPKEVRKMPVIYFSDLGLRNYAASRFGSLRLPPDLAMPFQNLVYGLIMKNLPENLFQNVKYWRTTDGAEVDIVIDFVDKVLPFEIKYQNLERIELSRSMKSFIRKYKPKKFYVVNLALEAQKKFGGTTIEAIPYWELMESTGFLASP